jgi:hypothetical protein
MACPQQRGEKQRTGRKVVQEQGIEGTAVQKANSLKGANNLTPNWKLLLD